MGLCLPKILLENQKCVACFPGMVEPALAQILTARFRSFSAVALLGPRQSGKTTLARTLARRHFSLEEPEERTRLDALWPEVVRGDGPVVFDEAQHWRELFSQLRGAIDADRKTNGRFILPGSGSPALMRNVSESLAGGNRWITRIEDSLAACAA